VFLIFYPPKKKKFSANPQMTHLAFTPTIQADLWAKSKEPFLA